MEFLRSLCEQKLIIQVERSDLIEFDSWDCLSPEGKVNVLSSIGYVAKAETSAQDNLNEGIVQSSSSDVSESMIKLLMDAF